MAGINLYLLGEQLTMPNLSYACHFDECRQGSFFQCWDVPCLERLSFGKKRGTIFNLTLVSIIL